MKTRIEHEKYDTKVEASDWRYAAAIVGLKEYFDFHGRNVTEPEITEEIFLFNSKDITEERYLEFVEYFYGEELQHRQVEKILHNEEFSEEQIKRVNDLLKSNSIMKKVFGKEKFDGENKEELLELITKNRKVLIKETFRNKSNMYANYANTGQLLQEGKTCCRLLGYYVDGGRKTKSISYNFDVNTFVSEDNILFDFIPFAFTDGRGAFFINDNCLLENLIRTNRNLKRRVDNEMAVSEGKAIDVRRILFKTIQETADFIDYDVEVIVKYREKEFFETLYIRRESIKILKALKVYEPFCFSVKLGESYWLNVQKEVMSCILNLTRTDYLIEFFLKQNSEYIVSKLIEINQLICGGGMEMNQSMKGAYACAKEVVKKIPENKRESYRQKLTSTIVFKDYDRFCQILLQLSNYSDVNFDFAFSLYEDFEANKDVAYTFINALTTKTKPEN